MFVKQKVISVFEHQALTAQNFDVPSDFAWLLEQDFEVFVIGRGTHNGKKQWQLMVRQYIGIISLPSGMVLEILPKAGKLVIGSACNGENDTQQLQNTRAFVQRMLAELIENDIALNPKTLPQLSYGIKGYDLKNHHPKSPDIKSDAKNHKVKTQPLNPLALSHTLDAPNASLLDWLLLNFINLLACYAPIRAYHTKTHNTNHVQGKLLVKKQLQHNAYTPQRFYSQLNELQHNTISNRFINQAWQQVSSLLDKSTTLTYKTSTHKNSASIASDSLPIQPNYHKSQQSNQHKLWQQLKKINQQWQAIKALSKHESQQLSNSYRLAVDEVTAAKISTANKQVGLRLLALAHWLLKTNKPVGVNHHAQQFLNSHHSASSAGVGFDRHCNHLNGLSSDKTTTGSQQAYLPKLCLFINMNHAFEAWVSVKIRQQFKHINAAYTLHLQPQKVWLLDGNRQPCVTAVPDILVKHNAKPSHVIDIKYKMIRSSSDINSSDAYQLAAYAQAFGVDKIWLVYPIYKAATPNHHSKNKGLKDKDVQTNGNAIENKPHGCHLLTSEGSLQIWLVPFNVNTGRIEVLDELLKPVHNKSDFCWQR